MHKSGKEDRVEWVETVETSDSGDLWQKDNSKNEKEGLQDISEPYCEVLHWQIDIFYILLNYMNACNFSSSSGIDKVAS